MTLFFKTKSPTLIGIYQTRGWWRQTCFIKAAQLRRPPTNYIVKKCRNHRSHWLQVLINITLKWWKYNKIQKWTSLLGRLDECSAMLTLIASMKYVHARSTMNSELASFPECPSLALKPYKWQNREEKNNEEVREDRPELPPATYMQ